MTAPAATAVGNTDVERFDDLGYVVLPNLLAREDVEECYAAFDAFPPVQRICHGAVARHNERTLLRFPLFFDVVLKPRLLDAVARILGDELQLISYDSSDTLPRSGVERDWHVDMSFWSDSVLTVNVGIYLQDMTGSIGPLAVVPGSHRWRRKPTEDEVSVHLEGEVEARVDAGSAVIFNAQLWHSPGRNDSDAHRRALFPYFGRYWIKRGLDLYDEPIAPLPDYVLEHEDPLVRQLFGFGLRRTLISTL